MLAYDACVGLQKPVLTSTCLRLRPSTIPALTCPGLQLTTYLRPRRFDLIYDYLHLLPLFSTCLSPSVCSTRLPYSPPVSLYRSISPYLSPSTPRTAWPVLADHHHHPSLSATCSVLFLQLRPPRLLSNHQTPVSTISTDHLAYLRLSPPTA